jgi:hypothetical protein
VNEHIVATFFALDETEALGRVEELHDALALADNLGRHAATTAAATAETATTAAAEAAAALTTAEAATTTAGETTAAAEAITATTAEPVLTCVEGIEAPFLFTEPIALVTSPTATSSVETHL